ncbi:MAG TPA: MFS transporter [Terracidiphilus sp.]|nr:MFS transporter [Terracidiphilus sp.]
MLSNNKWLVLVVVSTALFLISIDMTVLYTALPRLTHDLAADNSKKLWIVDTFPLVMAGLLPTMGVLGDRIGHRRTFLWGLLAFALASLIAAYAPSAKVLIAARAFLAVGASMMMPATLSLLRLTFTTDKERGQAIGIWAAVFSGGVAIGPLIGGALLSHFWWGSVFLINVPVVVMALIFTPFIVPAGKGNPERRLDLLNSVLAMVAMVSLVYALMETARPEAGLLEATFAGVIGVTVMVIFVRRQKRSPSPMIDFSLFGNGRFTAGVLTAMTGTLAGAGVQLALTQRLQLVIGYSPFHAALFMLPISISAFVAGSLNGFVLHKVGIGRALWTSLIMAATGLIGYAVFRNSSAVEQVANGFGVGVGSAIASTAIMINAPEDKAGMAASIESVAYELGGVLGVTILGSILSFTYTKALVLPQGIPAPALARDSLDQALLLAEHLSGDATVKLITQAKTAFDIAFVTVLVAGTAIMLLMAAVIARIISRAKTPEPSRVPPHRSARREDSACVG